MRRTPLDLHRSAARWPARGASLALALLGLLALAPTGAGAAGPRVYQTPQAALTDLTEALGSEDESAMAAIFGDEHAEIVRGTDEVAARAERKAFMKHFNEMHRLAPDGDDRMVLIVGRDAWPMPIPLVRGDEGWFFDAAAGAEEIVNRRIGRSELNAISVLRAYVDAQREYASADRDGDQVREFARQIESTDGQRDGLYWPSQPGEPASPFGPLVADARDYLQGRRPGDPFKGYLFKILTRQGSNVPGGRYDYIINGHMIAGYGMVAFPADYGSSGIMTFVVNHQGRVYERDLGEDTRFLAGGMDEYNPGDTWEPVEASK